MADQTSYCDVKAGEIDGSTNKKIVYIVYQTKTFMVSIDTDMNLNWVTSNEYGAPNYSTDFGEVVGSCNMAAAMVDRIFISKKNRLSYKKMLGEVIARVLDDRNSNSAIKILKVVDERINDHCKERVRMAYIYFAFGTVSVLGLTALGVAYAHKNFSFFTSDTNHYRIFMAVFLGGIGAFVTTFFRYRKYTGSVIAGLPIHRLDGFLRIFYGMVAGLIITLAIKGNALIGFANGSIDSQPWLGYFLAMVGGASEILIPNLIGDTEKNLRFKTKEDEEKEKSEAEAKEKEKANAAKVAEQNKELESNEQVNPGGKEEEKKLIQPVEKVTDETITNNGLQKKDETITEDVLPQPQTGNVTDDNDKLTNEIQISAELSLVPETKKITPGQSDQF